PIALDTLPQSTPAHGERPPSFEGGAPDLVELVSTRQNRNDAAAARGQPGPWSKRSARCRQVCTAGRERGRRVMSEGGAKKTILCIEDEHRLRQDILDERAEAGYGALGASDGREALALLNRKRPDLILCDISMPRLDGYGFLDA